MTHDTRCEWCGGTVPIEELAVVKPIGKPVTVCSNCEVTEPHPDEPVETYAGP